jgi:hypothetical protein
MDSAAAISTHYKPRSAPKLGGEFEFMPGDRQVADGMSGANASPIGRILMNTIYGCAARGFNGISYSLALMRAFNSQHLTLPLAPA